MVLSDTVDRRGTERKRNNQGNNDDPFSNMNQTHARVRSKPMPRSEAEIKRSSGVVANKKAKAAGPDKSKTKRKDGEYHALKMQTMLTPVSYGQRNAIKMKLGALHSFEQFGLLPSVLDATYEQALAGLMEVAPTMAQRLAIPELLSQKRRPKSKQKLEDGSEPAQYDQFLLAAETGSGKTLAYLLPIIDAVKRAEELEAAEIAQREADAAEVERTRKVFNAVPAPAVSAPHYTAGRPKAVILLPSSELVTQVGRVVKNLSHKVKFRSQMISAAYSGTTIRSRLFGPNGIDILVATPHLLNSIAKNDPNVLSRVSHLVIDEADSLLDRSFAPTTSDIIDKAAPSLKQLILCSATIPRSLDRFLDKRFPEIKRMVTPNLHAIPRRVQLGVVDVDRVPYKGNKDLACADVIWSIGKAGTGPEANITKNLLVFVNERETAEELARFLQDKGIAANALTRDTSEQRQAEILGPFTSQASAEAAAATALAAQAATKEEDYVPFEDSFITPQSYTNPSPAGGHRRLADTNVLVTTDLGSRGIDTINVRHVILYDVPHTTIDFIHRLGRTGRMGRRGRGIVLVGKKDRKDVVKEVREGMYRGQALI